ncbi:MAG: hypothetical protein D3904_14160, partial [Candidatus Electrothrix sp. EH2]|nr:hypothetical protein [Candidatus Electrothrix sp. EH2]
MEKRQNNMTGKQQNSDTDSPPSFGEILINPDAGEPSEGEEQNPHPPSEQKSKPGKPPAQRKKKTIKKNQKHP